MKSLGSISMYYPLLSRGEIEILQSLMEDSYRFPDFIASLCERIVQEHLSISLVYLGTSFAAMISDLSSLKRVSMKYGNNVLIRPYLQIAESYVNPLVDYDRVTEMANEALKEDVDDWIRLDLLDVKIFSGWLENGWTDKEDRLLEELDTLVECNEKLECFRPVSLRYKAEQWKKEGKMDEFFRTIGSAMQICRKYDDQIEEVDLILSTADSFILQDINTAQAMYKRALSICNSIGYEVRHAVYLGLGRISRIKGLFQRAVEEYQKAIDLKRSLPLVDTTLAKAIPCAMAAVYNEMEEAETALEWATAGLEELYSTPRGLAEGHLQMSWALSSLNRNKEAQEHMKDFNDLALKSGDSRLLPSIDFLQGVLEFNEGEIESAAVSLEKSYKESTEAGEEEVRNSSLLKLAESEVLLFSNSTEKPVDSMRWIRELEDFSRSNDFEGYLALSLVLKARMKLLQEKREEAQDLMKEIEGIYDEKEIGFLKQRIEALKKEL